MDATTRNIIEISIDAFEALGKKFLEFDGKDVAKNRKALFQLIKDCEWPRKDEDKKVILGAKDIIISVKDNNTFSVCLDGLDNTIHKLKEKLNKLNIYK